MRGSKNCLLLHAVALRETNFPHCCHKKQQKMLLRKIRQGNFEPVRARQPEIRKCSNLGLPLVVGIKRVLQRPFGRGILTQEQLLTNSVASYIIIANVKVAVYLIQTAFAYVADEEKACTYLSTP
jgi:hypothetical protein